MSSFQRLHNLGLQMPGLSTSIDDAVAAAIAWDAYHSPTS